MRHNCLGLLLAAMVAVPSGCLLAPPFAAWIVPDQEQLTVGVGEVVELLAKAEGGVRPYSFWWVSSSQSGPGRSGEVYQETFPFPGRFVVEVQATDSLGAVMVDSIVISVLPRTSLPPDRDGDGVPDTEDDCPDQLGPAANRGCPFPLPPGDRFHLTVEVRGSGRVGRSPERESYASGTKVAIFAFPDEGHQFIGWGGDASGGENSVEVVMNRDLTVIANFRPISFPPPLPEVNLLINGQKGPVILNFGEEAELSWSSKNATTAFAAGGWQGDREVAGRERVGPFHVPGIVSFTLTVIGPGGSAEDTVSLEIIAPPPPPLEILAVEISPPADDRQCYLVGEKTVITVTTNRDGEVRYLLPDSPVVGSVKAMANQAIISHIWPFPIQAGEVFVWPEDRDFEPDLKKLKVCVQER